MIHALKKDYRVTKVHHCIPLVLFYPLCCQQLIKKEVKTISEQKHPNVFGIKELLKTDNTENLVAISKKMTLRNPRKNWKIFQRHTKKQNRQTFWRIKNLLKQTRQKMLVTIPKKMIVRTPRKN